MLENCQEPNTYIVCTCKQNNKLILLTKHERLGAGTSPLNMKIKRKFQRNGSHLFDSVRSKKSIKSANSYTSSLPAQ